MLLCKSVDSGRRLAKGEESGSLPAAGTQHWTSGVTRQHRNGAQDAPAEQSDMEEPHAPHTYWLESLEEVDERGSVDR